MQSTTFYGFLDGATTAVLERWAAAAVLTPEALDELRPIVYDALHGAFADAATKGDN